MIWAAGLYAAPPILRIMALGLFAMLAFASVRAVLGVASISRQSRLAATYVPIFIPVTVFPMFFVGANLNRLLAAQQSPALASASQWLAAASVALLAAALATAPALPPGRARRSTGRSDPPSFQSPSAKRDADGDDADEIRRRYRRAR